MLGLEREFICKSCGLIQKHHVGITPIYMINEKEEAIYIPLRCQKCGKIHYVPENIENAVISEDEVLTITRKGVIAY